MFPIARLRFCGEYASNRVSMSLVEADASGKGSLVVARSIPSILIEMRFITPTAGGKTTSRSKKAKKASSTRLDSAGKMWWWSK